MEFGGIGIGIDPMADPLTYINLHKIWKQSVQDLLRYRVHKEMSVDAAA